MKAFLVKQQNISSSFPQFNSREQNIQQNNKSCEVNSTNQIAASSNDGEQKMQFPQTADRMKKQVENEYKQEENQDSFQVSPDLFSNGKEIVDTLLCISCQKLILDPSICLSCQQLYCSKCILQLINEDKGCLKCQSKSFLKKCPQLYSDFMSQIRIDCEYSKNQVPYPACSQISMKWKEAVEHKKICPYAINKCSNKECNFLGKKDELVNHYRACQFNKQMCPICKTPQKQITEHIKICPKKIVYCDVCSKRMTLAETKQHTYICTRFLCECGEKIAKSKEYGHEKICPMFIVQCEICQHPHRRKDLDQKQLCISALSNSLNLAESSFSNMSEQVQELKRILEQKKRN